jgi:hypothetical protein
VGYVGERMAMRSKYKLSGAAVAIGLVVGTFAGTAGAGASALGSLGIALPTTTSLASTTPIFVDGVEQVTLTATVDLDGLNGVLVTPSGSVGFSETYYSPGVGEKYYPVQTAKLSGCLLGLPSVVGLWQTTCSATVTFKLTYGNCGSTEISAGYSGTSDLIAGASTSVGSDVYLPASC